MKIIGKTSEGFIVTVENDEIKALLAVNDSRRNNDKDDKLKVGDDLTFTIALANLNLVKDIKLSGSYSTLDRLADARGYLNTLIETLKALETPLIEVKKLAEKGRA